MWETNLHPDIQEATSDLDFKVDPRQRSEKMQSIQSPKAGNPPWMDNVNADLFKADTALTTFCLQSLFKTIWAGEQIPEDWSTEVIERSSGRPQLLEMYHFTVGAQQDTGQDNYLSDVERRGHLLQKGSGRIPLKTKMFRSDILCVP